MEKRLTETHLAHMRWTKKVGNSSLYNSDKVHNTSACCFWLVWVYNSGLSYHGPHAVGGCRADGVVIWVSGCIDSPITAETLIKRCFNTCKHSFTTWKSIYNLFYCCKVIQISNVSQISKWKYTIRTKTILTKLETSPKVSDLVWILY